MSLLRKYGAERDDSYDYCDYPNHMNDDFYDYYDDYAAKKYAYFNGDYY